MSSHIIEAAKQYAALGWYVVPVRGKVPVAGQEWQHKTANTPENAALLFASFAHDGVGVQLGP